MKHTFISVPALGQSQSTLAHLKSQLASIAETHAFHIPEFKIGTLDALLLLTDELAKYDAVAEQGVNKVADILSTLVKDQPDAIVQDLLLVNDKTVDQYINTFQWNNMKYRTDKSLPEVATLLNQELVSMDNVIKNKLNAYSQNKASLQTLQRKQTGNLSIKSLTGIVKKHHCVLNSEYLTTVFVAVPKALYKQWNNKYETLTSMVVPRSSIKIAEDDEYGLFGVTMFQRVVDEFGHKAREEKFIIRDFQYSEDAQQTHQRELEEALAIEKEQHAELLRLCRTNFSEMFATWVHLKALRVFVESVLRYGLPVDFTSVSLTTSPKLENKVDELLVQLYGHLGGVHGLSKRNEASEEILDHELQSVNGNQYRPYVQFELNFDLERR